jgi:hypothetical protein
MTEEPQRVWIPCLQGGQALFGFVLTETNFDGQGDGVLDEIDDTPCRFGLFLDCRTASFTGRSLIGFTFSLPAGQGTKLAWNYTPDRQRILR